VGNGSIVASCLYSLEGRTAPLLTPSPRAREADAAVTAYVASAFRACVTTTEALASLLTAIEVGCTAQFLLEDVDQARERSSGVWGLMASLLLFVLQVAKPRFQRSRLALLLSCRATDPAATPSAPTELRTPFMRSMCGPAARLRLLATSARSKAYTLAMPSTPNAGTWLPCWRPIWQLSLLVTVCWSDRSC
jgi:hypothetical protein